MRGSPGVTAPPLHGMAHTSTVALSGLRVQGFVSELRAGLFVRRGYVSCCRDCRVIVRRVVVCGRLKPDTRARLLEDPVFAQTTLSFVLLRLCA